MTADDSRIDTSVPHSARICNYWLGGTDNYPVDRAAGYFDGLELVEPGVVLVDDWHPEPGVSRGPEIPQIGAVGRKR